MIERSFILLFFIALCFPSQAQIKTIQERLGYSKDTKLLILHADDIGVSHSENAATIAALENGLVNSGSIMVPCPWFPEIAAYAVANPEVDFGLHLTITSEWKYYKWGPKSMATDVPGLVNEHNFMYSNLGDVRENATAGEIEQELRKQIEFAEKFGIKPTHLDSHMFALYAKPEYLDVYRKIGQEYKLPILLNNEYLVKFGLDPIEYDGNVVLVDKLFMAFPPDYKRGMSKYYTESLRSVQPGLNVILLHAAFDNAEMQAVTDNHEGYGSKWRQADFDFFTSNNCQDILEEQNIHLITWREIKEKLLD